VSLLSLLTKAEASRAPSLPAPSLPPSLSLSLSLLRARSLSSLSLSMLIAPVALDNLDLQVFSLFFLLQQDTNFEIHQHNTHLGILENLKNHRKSNNKPNPKKKKLRDL
jgi:hypothetical protein